MSGHSILYLGRSDFASEYLAELETLPYCTMLARSPELRVPVENPDLLDIVLLEASPVIAQSGNSLSTLIHSLRDYPVVAITDKEHEHRGIAAMRAGAQGYICIDDITVEGQEAVFDHAAKRYRLQQRLSDTDVSVLSVLTSINDGVIVVDSEGSILDINPAARTILGLGPRWMPDASWEQTFCCIDEYGNNYKNSADLPLVRARSGAKFMGQVTIYRAPEQPDTYLNINPHHGTPEAGAIRRINGVTEPQRVCGAPVARDRPCRPQESTTCSTVCRSRPVQVGERHARS
jgi:PAS domain-containing protein